MTYTIAIKNMNPAELASLELLLCRGKDKCQLHDDKQCIDIADKLLLSIHQLQRNN